MSSTIAELHLSGPYRQAQRSLAAWLEQGHAAARRSMFGVRAALAALDSGERHQLARWLAWLAAAQLSRQQAVPRARLQRLDTALFEAMEEAMARLPAGFAQMQTQTRRLSA